MILRHFQLREQPFGVTPDPRFLFSSATHREALAALLYGLDSGVGFVALTANPGMGKTTLLFDVLARTSETAKTVFLFQTVTSPADLFRALLIDLGVDKPQGTLVDHQTQLNQILVELARKGTKLVLFLDEAQTLDDSVLEAVRMLSNFETGHKKLMQIVLSGQLQLAERLAERSLQQLRQRISIFAHLKPLTVHETSDYIQHRVKVAGYAETRPLFSAEAVALIGHASEGIPRNINSLCFNALTIACAMKQSQVSADAVREAIADLDIRAVIGAKPREAEIDAAPIAQAAAVIPIDLRTPSGSIAAARSNEELLEQVAEPEPAAEILSARTPQTALAAEPDAVAVCSAAELVAGIDTVLASEAAAKAEATAGLVATQVSDPMAEQPVAAAATQAGTAQPALEIEPGPADVAGAEPPVPAAAPEISPGATTPAAKPAAGRTVPVRGAIRALEARMRREPTLAAKGKLQQLAAAKALRKQPEAKSRTPMGLGRALAGSLEELRDRWRGAAR